MFKKITIAFLLFAFLLVPTAILHADPVNPPCDGGDGGLVNPLAGAGICNLLDFMSWLIMILAFFIGLFAVLSIVIAGYQMVMGGGDPEKIKTAKNRIYWSIIGVVITLLAYSIVRIVLNLIGTSAT